MKKKDQHEPVRDYVRIAMNVGAVWAVVYSFKHAQFLIEDLARAVEKNHHAFLDASAEDWLLILGLFSSPQEAADALSAWMRTSSKWRMADLAIYLLPRVMHRTQRTRADFLRAVRDHRKSSSPDVAGAIDEEMK
jgi:hypothetical protein